MGLGPRPTARGLLLLLLCATAAATAGDAHGEHRTDYDREALLGGQVRRRGRGPGREGGLDESQAGSRAA